MCDAENIFFHDLNSNVVHLFDGWHVNGGDCRIQDLSNLFDADETHLTSKEFSLLGEFSYLRFCADGTGFSIRSSSGTYPIFFCETADVQVVSNRAALASFLANLDTKFSLNESFVLSMLGVGWALFYDSICQGIRSLHPQYRLRVENHKFIVESTSRDIWYDSELTQLYLSDRNAFYDRLLVEMESSISHFAPIIKESNPILFLSGGKDSRLIFALLNKLGLLEFCRVTSTGSPYLPDVVIAQHIARHYEVPLSVSDSVFTDIDYSDHLCDHILLTEGAIGPFNLARLSCTNSEITLTGHELGLREDILNLNKRRERNNNPDAIFEDVVEYFEGFDYANLLTKEAKEYLRCKAWESFKQVYETTVIKENAGWRFRNEYRTSGYVIYIKFMSILNKGFSPYILMLDNIIKMAYAAGASERFNEMLHFETIWRLDKWLTKCPFANQEWSSEVKKKLWNNGVALSYALRPSNSDLAPRLGPHAVFSKNKDKIFDFILSNISQKIKNYIDLRNLNELRIKNISNRQLRTIFNLFMLTFIENQSDWGSFVRKKMEKNQGPQNLPNLRYISDRTVSALNLGEYRGKIYGQLIPEIIWDYQYNKTPRELRRHAFAKMKQGEHFEAYSLFHGAAMFGCDQSYFMMGKLCLEGLGVEKNEKKAIQYFSIAADAGYQEAKASLARCYDKGIGVEKDSVKACLLYKEAVAAGNKWVLERLGELLNDDESQELFRKAFEFYYEKAQEGHAFAQFKIGEMYLTGKGTSIDVKQSTYWLEKASLKGFKPTERKLF